MGMGMCQNIGNGNGQEWEQTLMGMGMCHIPMGIDSHRLVSQLTRFCSVMCIII